MADVVDITRQLELRSYYRNPALAQAQYLARNVQYADVAPVLGLASGKESFMTWAEANRWSDSDWQALIILTGYTNLNRIRPPSGGDR